MESDSNKSFYERCTSDPLTEKACFHYADSDGSPTPLTSRDPDVWKKDQLWTLSKIREANTQLKQTLTGRFPRSTDWDCRDTHKFESISPFFARRKTVLDTAKKCRDRLQDINSEESKLPIDLTRRACRLFEDLQTMSADERQREMTDYESAFAPFSHIEDRDELQRKLFKPLEGVGDVKSGTEMMSLVREYRAIKKGLKANDESRFGGQWEFPAIYTDPSPSHSDDIAGPIHSSRNAASVNFYEDCLREVGLTREDIQNALGLTEIANNPSEGYKSQSETSACELANSIQRALAFEFRGSHSKVEQLLPHCGKRLPWFPEIKLSVSATKIAGLAPAVLARSFQNPAETYQGARSMTADDRATAGRAFDRQVRYFRDEVATSEFASKIDEYRRLVYEE